MPVELSLLSCFVIVRQRVWAAIVIRLADFCQASKPGFLEGRAGLPGVSSVSGFNHSLVVILLFLNRF